jgi:hypothetical protein
MSIYYAVLVTVVVAAVVAVAVHLIRTLGQVNATARELEFLARKANAEMDKVGTVTSTVAGLASSMSGSTGRMAAGLFNLVLTLIQRYRRQKPVDIP